MVTTPIRLVPSTVVAPLDVAGFTAALASSLRGWYRTSSVDPQAGFLAFELSVFTAAQSRVASRPGRAARAGAVPPGAVGATVTPPAKPILRLTNLQLALKTIDWSGEA
jgi:hypothetical protein